jgi:hypothetical protein
MANRIKLNNKLLDYKNDLVSRYWNYQTNVFPKLEDYFERSFASDGRPPVFLRQKSEFNVITKPGASQDEINSVLALIPKKERHKWFRSMNSSQALTQSILGNLAIYNYLDHLTEILDDEGQNLLSGAQVSSENFFMEFKIDYLGEPRRTSLDAFFSGGRQVAIECKFTEADVGTCSRPRLKPKDSNYTADFCVGNFTRQRGRKERCSLTEIGVSYWKYIPYLFNWSNDADHKPCPLFKNYQLVRNLLAISVQPEMSVSLENGHVLLIYDERNPAFNIGGKGLKAFNETKKALKNPTMLRKCSWQRIVKHIRNKSILPWLVEHLNLKYGL